jgi:hypothetical protein
MDSNFQYLNFEGSGSVEDVMGVDRGDRRNILLLARSNGDVDKTASGSSLLRLSLPTRSDFQTAMKGDRLRPLRSAQAVAVHQDGIGGRSPGRALPFSPGPKQNSALCVAGTDCGLAGRAHAALMQGVVLSEN